MNTLSPAPGTISTARHRFGFAILLLAVFALLAPGCAERIQPQAFDTPRLAVDALIAAVRTNDKPAMIDILGSDGEDIIESGDAIFDAGRRAKFISLYEEKHAIVEAGPDKSTLTVGAKEWPFPIPIVNHPEAGWYFDTAAGREEIINRRIGQNELDAIEVCKAIGDAQREYAMQTTSPGGLRVYAQKVSSDAGQRNGLYWPSAPGEARSPLGQLAAKASAEGYKRKEGGPTPYHGYYYRILTAQGPNAPDGALDYMVKGHMVLGFAVVAYPADYGNSGIMTFIMNADGVVYQKDLGKNTQKIASAMKAYDPDSSWKKVDDKPAAVTMPSK